MSFGLTLNGKAASLAFINIRVPIKLLFDYLAGGDPLDEFLAGFPPVTCEQAEKALELAKNNFLTTLSSGENATRPQA